MATGRYERELLNTLSENGRMALRAPASGAGRSIELPDVLVGQAREGSLSDVWAIECKSISGTTAYAEQEEIVDLLKFTEFFGGQAFLAGRFTDVTSGQIHYLCKPENCRVTPSGNYGVPQCDAKERASVLVDCKHDMVQILDEGLLPPETESERPERDLTEWGES